MQAVTVFETQVNTLSDTCALAKAVAEGLKGGEVILLNGELGAGKTTFTKFLASELGITETVTSPTFITVKEYKSGRIPFVHADMYRRTEKDNEDIAEYLLFHDACFVLEWNKLNIPAIKKIISIDIEVISETERKFTIKKNFI
ncbi:MAG: tRNA (adenosine(37)-N6)-threonylcarbamoyltransferase complex ATPase subunit type 1 TsaE [Christensenellaceae bacterium]|jgi:tRNA threonylcarbamoyladenosine biosynthesis protein TsaE|nr:tRNA (adenosine(37)-N6)-threonylcarbamoyltransferase complex ATPase subunit type 1 TsaE [Christensenellaceae bacterium]